MQDFVRDHARQLPWTNDLKRCLSRVLHRLQGRLVRAEGQYAAQEPAFVIEKALQSRQEQWSTEEKISELEYNIIVERGRKYSIELELLPLQCEMEENNFKDPNLLRQKIRIVERLKDQTNCLHTLERELEAHYSGLLPSTSAEEKEESEAKISEKMKETVAKQLIWTKKAIKKLKVNCLAMSCALETIDDVLQTHPTYRSLEMHRERVVSAWKENMALLNQKIARREYLKRALKAPR